MDELMAQRVAKVEALRDSGREPVPSPECPDAHGRGDQCAHCGPSGGPRRCKRTRGRYRRPRGRSARHGQSNVHRPPGRQQGVSRRSSARTSSVTLRTRRYGWSTWVTSLVSTACQCGHGPGSRPSAPPPGRCSPRRCIRPPEKYHGLADSEDAPAPPLPRPDGE